MNIEEIKGDTFEVDILKEEIVGDRLSYKVYNEKLGGFVISICDYTSDPQFFQKPRIIYTVMPQ